MSERYVPIYLVGTSLRCLVVGGGVVAQRKAENLRACGAAVTVVSPRATPRLSALAKQSSLRWLPQKYRSSCMNGVNLVVGATNDPAVNQRVYRDACALGIPVNIVDDPAHCTFIVPSVLTKGPIQIAVSTGGAAPLVAAKLRREIEEIISNEHVSMVTELGKMRPTIKRLCAPDKQRFWSAVNSLCVSSFKGKSATLKRRLRSALGKPLKAKGAAAKRKAGRAR